MDWFDALQEAPSGSLEDPREAFRRFSDEEGVPLMPRKVWESFIERHDKDVIRRALADHVHEAGAPFPYQQIRPRQVRGAFKRLRWMEWQSIVGEYDPRYEARYDYGSLTEGRGLGLVPRNNAFNVISNRYQQVNRYACSGYTTRSPLSIWRDQEALASMNWPFWRYPDRGINRERFRHSFAISQYVAMQFKPQVAKALYGWLGRGVVLDPSSGWGDRLAGFYCEPGVHTYLGCDPNRQVWEVYKAQALDYERFLGGSPEVIEGEIEGFPYFTVRGIKTVTIFCAPAEDAPWERVVPDIGVDLVFTSPPYFGVERYAEGTSSEANQSWARYPDFDQWLHGFLLPLFARLSGFINKDGFCAVNIVDPLWKNSRLEVCQPLHDAMVGVGMTYEGFVAMALRKRLSPDGSGLDRRFAEPVWVFGKGGRTVPEVRKPDVLDLFGSF